MVWYKELNPFCRRSEPIEFVIREDLAKILFGSIEYQVKKNFEYKSWYSNLQNKETSMENSLLKSLEGQIFGHIMIATQDLKQNLTKRRELENLLQDGNDLNRTLQNMIIEVEATIDAIKLNLKFWDSDKIIIKSEKYLKLIKSSEITYFGSVIKKVQMIGVRIGYLPKIESTLNCKWPKLREKEAIFQYIEILRYQIYELKNDIKYMESKTKYLCKKLKKIDIKYLKLKENDKFERSYFFGKRLSFNSENLETWEYVNRNFKFANLSEHVCIAKLLDEISILENHQLALNDKINELEQTQEDNKIIRDQQTFLQKELARKNRLLTQVAIENITFRQDESFKNVVLSECPERENVIIQQLIQNEIELSQKVVQLEQKIKTSSKQADLHGQHSHHVVKTLKTLIEYLEEVTQEFLRDETSQRELICKLDEVLSNEQLDSLKSSLCEQDLTELKLALEKGNVEEVLNKLNHNVINSRAQFYRLTQKLTETDLTNLIASLTKEKLNNMAEALAQQKFDRIVTILKDATATQQSSENVPETSDIVKQIISLIQNLSKNCE